MRDYLIRLLGGYTKGQAEALVDMKKTYWCRENQMKVASLEKQLTEQQHSFNRDVEREAKKLADHYISVQSARINGRLKAAGVRTDAGALYTV